MAGTVKAERNLSRKVFDFPKDCFTALQQSATSSVSVEALAMQASWVNEVVIFCMRKTVSQCAFDVFQVASTTWSHLLRRVNGALYGQQQTHLFKSYSRSTRVKIWRKSFKFTFVRHPFERLVSAHHDKFLDLANKEPSRSVSAWIHRSNNKNAHQLVGFGEKAAIDPQINFKCSNAIST